MGRNCENLNYSVFLSPQQTKPGFDPSSHWVRVWMLLPCFDPDPQILLPQSFMSPSKSSWKMMFIFLLNTHVLKASECFIMTLEERKCELFTLARHFSDDTLCLKLYSVSSKITFYCLLCLRLSSLLLWWTAQSSTWTASNIIISCISWFISPWVARRHNQCSYW